MTFEPSAAQKRVMISVGQGWSAFCLRGTVVEVNGKEICTCATMEVLERAALVVKQDIGRGVTEWKATDAGKEFTQVFLLRG